MKVVTTRRSCVRVSSCWVIALSLVSPACVSIYLGGEPVAEVTTPPDREEDDTAVSSPTPTLAPTPAPTPSPTPTAVPVVDSDGDGVALPNDCDDTNPNVAPGLPELCQDLLDSNCDGNPSDGCPTCEVEALQASLSLYVDGEEVKGGESIEYREPILFRTTLRNTCAEAALLKSESLCFASLQVFENEDSMMRGWEAALTSSSSVASFQTDCSAVESEAIIPPGDSIEVEWLWFQMDEDGEFVKPATSYIVKAEWASQQEVFRTFALSNCSSPSTFCAE